MQLVDVSEVKRYPYLAREEMEKAYGSKMIAAVVVSPPLHIPATSEHSAMDFEESWRVVLLDKSRKHECFSDNRLKSCEAAEKWCDIHGYGEHEVWKDRTAFMNSMKGDDIL